MWTELADGSCRWRQTGGELKVLALKVPGDLPSRQLAVDIQPYSIKGEQALPTGPERAATAHHSNVYSTWVWRGMCCTKQHGDAASISYSSCSQCPASLVLPPPHAVWNRADGEVYLEGELERGVVPEDCFWTHCGGEGEDGCALYLRKMNLEVLQQ